MVLCLAMESGNEEQTPAPTAVAASSSGASAANNTAGGGIGITGTGGAVAVAVSVSRQSPKVTVCVPTASLLQRNVSPSMPRKIMSKNNNNTIFPTSYPTNLAELQLFRVMQNASLLVYYDTLLEMGGDDVQQLCDAGEEEFLEIMSLVGMASKPLHVRRLQKSLQEWVTNPCKFKTPLQPTEDYDVDMSSSRVASNHTPFYPESPAIDISRSIYSPSPGDICTLPPITSPGLTLSKRPYSPLDQMCPTSSNSSPGNNMSSQMTPTLMESQISKLAAAAERLSKHLPQFEPKPHNTKKKVCKELELVMSMSENDPRRMDEIRRYAAIYGRFDCKRKPEKPLTLHEVSVNEAAAQICRFVPVLLTRRDELFPLARQVVKDSGCYYSKTQLSSMYLHKNSSQERDLLLDNAGSVVSARSSPRMQMSETDGVLSKKPKLESNSDNDDPRQDTNSDDSIVMRTSLHSLFQHHSKNLHSARESLARRTSSLDYEDGDSHFSFSSSSSPSQISTNEQDSCFTTGSNLQRKFDDQSEGDASKYSPKVQVIAASGDNIIAVANPALAMSPAILAPLVEPRDTVALEKD